MTVNEIAEKLEVNPRTVRLWISDGKIFSEKRKSRVWISEENFQKFLNENPNYLSRRSLKAYPSIYTAKEEIKKELEIVRIHLNIIEHILETEIGV